MSRGVMKPDIVFFGEGLPDSFHTAMAKDKDQCDLLIVIGSSLKVRPVALIPSKLKWKGQNFGKLNVLVIVVKQE